MVNRKKVVFVVPSSVGGAERVTLTIAKLLDHTKFEVIVAVIGNSRGDIVNFIPKNVQIFHVRIRNLWDFTLFKMIRLFKEVRPNIVFCSLIYLNIIVMEC